MCSILCSFITTLNDEQINIVEDVLFENLFSSVLIKALLASDIICFLCRTRSTFAYEICHVLISMLSQIYIEDAEIVDTECSLAYSNSQLTQEILINLCNRIMVFLKPSEINLIKQSFELNEYLFLWKHFNYNFIESNSLENSQQYFDKLFLLTKQQQNTQISNLIVDSFPLTHNSYKSLLLLRLLDNFKFRLNFEQHKLIISSIPKMITQFNIKYNHQILVKILKFLNSLAYVESFQYKNEKFQNKLIEVLKLINDECNINFIMTFYFYSFLQNISMNDIFSNVIQTLSSRMKIRKDLKLIIKYYMVWDLF